mgnify:CR=1 FL=1
MRSQVQQQRRLRSRRRRRNRPQRRSADIRCQCRVNVTLCAALVQSARRSTRASILRLQSRDVRLGVGRLEFEVSTCNRRHYCSDPRRQSIATAQRRVARNARESSGRLIHRSRFVFGEIDANLPPIHRMPCNQSSMLKTRKSRMQICTVALDRFVNRAFILELDKSCSCARAETSQ